MLRPIALLLIVCGGTAAAQEGLIPDRRAPEAYPTLAAQPDQAGALDGTSATALDDAMADDTLAAMMGVVAGQGCAIAESDVAQVFGAEGFTPDEVLVRLTGLLVEGVAGLDAAGRMTFPAALCPPDRTVPTPRDNLLDAFRAAPECRLSEDDFLAALPDYDRDRLTALARPMVEAGDLVVEGLDATLSDALCADAG